MARQPMVTRTITSTQVTLMCVDTVAGEIINETIILPRTYKDNMAILKAVKSINLGDTIKVVDVVDTQVKTQLYRMPEEKFVEYAEPVNEKEN